ncbi:hypothetical protein [Ekhidna sp.]
MMKNMVDEKEDEVLHGTRIVSELNQKQGVLVGSDHERIFFRE